MNKVLYPPTSESTCTKMTNTPYILTILSATGLNDNLVDTGNHAVPKWRTFKTPYNFGVSDP